MSEKKTYYKLTNTDRTTHDGFVWEIGKWYEADGTGDLCGPGWLHFYHSADMAVLMNPGHANITNPLLWEAECEGKSLDVHGLKIGWTRARIVREIPLPEWSLEQKIIFGILCAKMVYHDASWNEWADRWLNGYNRTKEAARAAEAAAWAARTLEGKINFQEIIAKAKLY